MNTAKKVLLWVFVAGLLLAVPLLRSRTLFVPCAISRSYAVLYHSSFTYILPPDDGFPAYPPLCLSIYGRA
ncbi:MAG TPA: hypothetical protein VMJ64_17575 [Anaerolineales bacterium]|nr:hypothetical protein [Anaerolineales bacterium]